MRFAVGLCQLLVTPEKKENVQRAAQMVAQAASQGAKMVCLPEMFVCPYESKYFGPMAEEGQGPTFEALSDMARQNNVYLFGGSIPERRDGRVYNTCYIFGPDGALLGQYSKSHLFDVNVKDGVVFQESAFLAPGNEYLIVNTPYCKVGILICFDVRFPESARLLAEAGAKLIFLPAAFNPTTGPAHWHLTLRARALDNQVYFAGVSPAVHPDLPYRVYGHTALADPWGRIVAEAEEEPALMTVFVDMDYVDGVRRQLPLLSARRADLYELKAAPGVLLEKP